MAKETEAKNTGTRGKSPALGERRPMSPGSRSRVSREEMKREPPKTRRMSPAGLDRAAGEPAHPRRPDKRDEEPTKERTPWREAGGERTLRSNPRGRGAAVGFPFGPGAIRNHVFAAPRGPERTQALPATCQPGSLTLILWRFGSKTSHCVM